MLFLKERLIHQGSILHHILLQWRILCDGIIVVLEYSLLCCMNNFLLKRLYATIDGNNGHAAINPVVLMYIRTDELCHFYAWYNLSYRRMVVHIRTVLHTQLKHQSSILLALGDRNSRFPSQRAPHKGSVIRKGFSSHGVIMPRANVTSSDKRSTPWALICNHLFFMCDVITHSCLTSTGI